MPLVMFIQDLLFTYRFFMEFNRQNKFEIAYIRFVIIELLNRNRIFRELII